MKKGIVIIRGKPEDHSGWSKMEEYIQENDIEIEGQENNKELKGNWFYDYRSDDSNWSFERYEDRFGFLKGCEREVDVILVEKDFFSSIGQIDKFQQMLIVEVIRKVGMELICIDGEFISEEYTDVKGSNELFGMVQRSDKLRLTLSRLRTKQRNEEKGIVNLQGEGKISGRKSYLQKDPELVRRVRNLRGSGYKNREISDILFNMGYKTRNGNPFNTGQISKLYQQSELLPKKNEGEDQS